MSTDSQSQEPEFASDWQRQEHRDNADIAKAHIALADWTDSGEKAANLRLINSHLDSLPAEERERYEQNYTADGTARLNDVETLRALALDARKAPAALEALTKLHGGNERAAIESLMPDRGSVYWKSERIQARYRDLIREGQQVTERLEKKL